MDMDEFIHRENLTLFKKRLAEARTDAERELLLKLLAEEEEKEPLLNKGTQSRVDQHQGAADRVDTVSHSGRTPDF